MKKSLDGFSPAAAKSSKNACASCADVMATANPLPLITGTLLYWYSASGAIFSTLRPRTCTKILSLKMTISKSSGY
ncbi:MULTISPECIES: hypothetical protein [unclassified Roseburia]|uniref:hypothetical protein n=1 Tax=unclassified Roseburia TaxID=2637578 RepID=UPI002E8E214B|nr:hypothetical protein [Roseburia sp. AF42-8]